MTQDTFRDRLQLWFDRDGGEGEALGIDLGTTKSCVAAASYDPASGDLDCYLVRFGNEEGESTIAVPSAVALDQGRVLVGAKALAKRGQKGFIPERTFFYETKNTIGLRYTYPNAKPKFTNATDIATHVLGHLREIIYEEYAFAPDAPPVVACPASFHASQRRATILAAERAFGDDSDIHFDPEDDDCEPVSNIRLLDEPYAAFLDLLFREPEASEKLLQPGNTLLVFDFGGGTCDVAIFRVGVEEDSPIGARLLATSRYHRLGGGDIDRAIVHEVLIPQLVKENTLGQWELGWHDKAKRLEPVLIDAAEELKLKMSRFLANGGKHPEKINFKAARNKIEAQWHNGEIAGDEREAALDALMKKEVAAQAEEQSGIPFLDNAVILAGLSFDVEIGGVTRRLTLKQPTLEKAEFLNLLKPILDHEPPPESGDEFVQRSSIFSPVKQALLRAGLEPGDIDGVLMCGCSSLLPPVQTALRSHFPNASCVLMGEDEEELQGIVARGAALQALADHVLGRKLIEPVCSSELSLVVSTGTVALAKAGETLPLSSDGVIELHPPRDSEDEAVDIAVEVVIDGKRTVGRTLWQLPAPVSKRDSLLLAWHLDENQCLELNLRREDANDEEPITKRFDSPITHCDMGQTVRCRMLERMEAMRSGKLPRTQLGLVSERIARDAGALGEYERALHFVSIAMQERGDDPSLLNLRGIYRKNLGDLDGALDAYKQAAEDWTGARFNLALLHYNAGRHVEALKAVDSALEDDPTRAYRVLRGDILDKLGRNDEARKEWQDAIHGNIDFGALEEFDLGWLDSCAQRLSQTSVQEKIREARERKAQHTLRVSRQGELPVYAGQPLRDMSDLV